LIRENRKNIFRASVATSEQVSPMEIASVIFQENRNDKNLIRNKDSTSFLGIGGPEIKNRAGKVMARFGSNRSFGIGEMKIETAAPHLGMDPEQLTNEQRAEIVKKLENPESAILLVALELKRLKDERTDYYFPASLLGSAYNTGDPDIESPTEVGLRGFEYYKEIGDALFPGPETDYE
jgi:hypothetical protein